MVLASFRFLGRIPADCSNRQPRAVGQVRARPFRPAALRIGRARSCRGSAAGRPELPGARPCCLPSCPGVHSFSRALACSTLIGVASSAIRSTAWRWREVVAELVEAPAVAQPLEQLLGRRCPRARRSARAPRASRSSVGSISSASTTAASTASRRSALLGVGLGLVGERLLVLAGDLQVGLLGDALVGERVQHLLPQLARARVDERVGHARPRPRRRRRRARPRGTRASIARSSASRSRVGDVLAQLVERVEARRVDGEVVVELGQLLGLDLLDRDLELRRLARRGSAPVVVGEGDLDGRARRRRWRRSSCSSKPGTSRPEPSSISWSRPSPPANGSPSTRCRRSR